MASQQFWIKVGDKVHGPFSPNQLRELAVVGKLQPEHLISKDREHWSLAEKVKGLQFQTEASQRPTNASQQKAPSPQPAEDRIEATTERRKLPTFVQGLTQAPRTVLIACIVWMVFGALQLLNSFCMFAAALLLLKASHDAEGGKAFDLEDVSFAAALGGLFALGLAGFGGCGVATLTARTKAIRGIGAGSLVVGALPIVILVAISFIKDLSNVPTGIWLLFVIAMTLPVLMMVAGVLAMAGSEAYSEWRTNCWEHIPNDAPERLAVEDPARYQRERKRARLEWIASKVPPLHLLPRPLQSILVQLVVVAITLGVGFVLIVAVILVGVAIVQH